MAFKYIVWKLKVGTVNECLVICFTCGFVSPTFRPLAVIEETRFESVARLWCLTWNQLMNIYRYLVGGLVAMFCFSIYWELPTDFHILQRGGSTTNQRSFCVLLTCAERRDMGELLWIIYLLNGLEQTYQAVDGRIWWAYVFFLVLNVGNGSYQ